jgi:hypothetical protein
MSGFRNKLKYSFIYEEAGFANESLHSLNNEIKNYSSGLGSGIMLTPGQSGAEREKETE